eukprot:CAMPEP_0182443578 /NCGR_PEP_ID=MMETSP1172-20130603/2283_1 /TAXON_ID=708627 /ORGANISM="Timspurckia oligopyrenoides, Strain CCMP3278" /LENGTH=139 /DNA_ID=CAMNT_0024638909 /DNA_START=263 /DNA_END=682 /DNA_ORIENTATION=+
MELSPKVSKLLDEIVQLNMLEVKELSSGLKDRLGLADLPSMPMGGMMAMPAAPAKAADAPAAAPKVEEKTSFTVRLTGFDAAKKIGIIKEIRTLTGLGLKEAKALVDSAPVVVKENLTKDDAAALQEKLTAAGATSELE